MGGDLFLRLDLVRRRHEQPFAGGVDGVVTTLGIDDRRDRTLTIRVKVAAVEAHLKGEAH